MSDLFGPIRPELAAMKRLSLEDQQSFEQIQELAALREEYIRQKGLTQSLKHIRNKLGIYPTAVKRLAPELYDNWNDINFHWK